MAKIKYWLLGGIVLICLCAPGLLAKFQSTEGTRWEYARYQTSTVATSVHGYSWGTPTEHFFTTSTNASEVWRKAGFNFDDKEVLVEDWFNFLGKQGWELITIEGDRSSVECISTQYWFKRRMSVR